MTTGLSHKKEFIQDTERILDRLKALLTDNNAKISNIYREVHSLKGAAGFAGLINMEHLAHTLEGLLTGIRDGKVSFDSEVESIFYHVQDYFIKDVNSWKNRGCEIEPADIVEVIEEKSQISESISIEVIEDSNSKSFFDDFEQELLKEAMFRGEQFYKIICHIDREEEMKYPRLFLVVNNLEKISNVIKIHPSLDEITKNRSKQITLYLTTDKGKSDIYKGLSFDRIREVEFLRLDYTSFFNQDFDTENSQEINLYGNTIDVETSKIEEIFNYAQDLHSKLLLDDLVKPDKKILVEELLTGMKNSLTTLTTITFEKAFSDFDSYCSKLAVNLGKKVSFSIIGGDITVERSLAEVLKELTLQLVKNSIDHGIETPLTREESGKNPVGKIVLKVSRINNCLALKLVDDGKGIDRKTVLKKGIDGNFIDGNEEISLLSLLSRPGFSTSEEVNHYSGRGVGLDIVVNRVINKLDGKVKIENHPGKGLIFDIVIPPATLVKKFSLFKYRNNHFAVSSVNVVDKIELDKESVSFGDNSTLNYSYNGTTYPIFTPWGRLSSSNCRLKEKYGFIIRYLGKKAFFPVDEFVLEKEFFSSVITFINTNTPSLKKVKVGDELEDFIFVSPSIINS